MIKTLTLFAAVAAIAGPASAESITVSVVGKDAATIHADIAKAANKVCNQAFRLEAYQPHELQMCVTATIRNAEGQLAAAPAPERLASK